MKSIGKIIGVLALFVFISWQSAYSQGLGGLTSGINQKLGNISNGIKQYGSKKIDNVGAAIKIESIKSKTGDFVGEHTNSNIGGFVTSSSWRNAATSQGFKKASGILQGTATGIMGGDGAATAIKKGNLKGPDLAKGAFHNNPNKGGFSLNVNPDTPSTEMFYSRDNNGKITETQVYTDNTGKQLTQEFMGLSTKSPEISTNNSHLMIRRSKLTKEYDLNTNPIQ